IRYQAKTDLIYSVGTFNFTYGVTDDLDINIAIPIATLDMDLDVTRQDTPTSPVRRATAREDAAFVSDMLVRAKYRLFDTTWALGTAIGAGGLRVRIPSGKVTQGLGTGYGEIVLYFALSTARSRAGSLRTGTWGSMPASGTRGAARRTTAGRSTSTRRGARS